MTCDPAAPWRVVRQHAGSDAARAANARVLGGKGDPRLGRMRWFSEPG